MIADHFTEAGGRAVRPQVVSYAKFCQAVDEVFNTGDQTTNVKMTSSPSSTMMGASFRRNDVDDEERLMNLLHKVAVLCKTRGIVLKYCFTDQDRAPNASPSRMNPKAGGKVTKNQFIRNFPFKKEFADWELEMLAERYRVGGPESTSVGDVHFMALHNDVTEAMDHEMPPYPRSDLFLKPDDTEWSHQKLHPVQKLQSRVVEKRLRLYEHFQDFDPLRKGVCTVGQTKTVFTMMDLTKEIDRVEFDMVAGAYMRDDGLFCYKDFCNDIDRGFTTPNLETDPLAMTTMPDATSTALGRRNRITMTPNRGKRVDELEDQLRSRVRKRGIFLKPMFQDMDRTNRGHVSRNQFARILHMLGFELDERQIGLLCAKYCDLGNHNDVNYVDFMKSIDPPDEDQELAMEQNQAPHQEVQCSKYFDARGTVRPLDRVGSPLIA
uniref:EF-hand domain-containing protein n=1 Tax=Alexandrium andersonii TaxID=327968 RepID=A0A7S2MSP4_9DINO|mmetsp:Transcript_75082/g.168118  ORF Transcript_75082/g.168118 Transcript_75082/m.168118 type:complete len:436 (+) Transcript_75082:3-1310(+)